MENKFAMTKQSCASTVFMALAAALLDSSQELQFQA
jgi:hypothetical protein